MSTKPKQTVSKCLESLFAVQIWLEKVVIVPFSLYNFVPFSVRLTVAIILLFVPLF